MQSKRRPMLPSPLWIRKQGGTGEMVQSESGHKLNKSYEWEKMVVLTFYKGQAELLSKELRKLPDCPVSVATVDSYQGKEAEVVILPRVLELAIRIGHAVSQSLSPEDQSILHSIFQGFMYK